MPALLKLTPFQLAVMQTRHNRDFYVGAAECRAIACHLKLQPEQVKAWFKLFRETGHMKIHYKAYDWKDQINNLLGEIVEAVARGEYSLNGKISRTRNEELKNFYNSGEALDSIKQADIAKKLNISPKRVQRWVAGKLEYDAGKSNSYQDQVLEARYTINNTITLDECDLLSKWIGKDAYAIFRWFEYRRNHSDSGSRELVVLDPKIMKFLEQIEGQLSKKKETGGFVDEWEEQFVNTGSKQCSIIEDSFNQTSDSKVATQPSSSILTLPNEEYQIFLAMESMMEDSLSIFGYPHSCAAAFTPLIPHFNPTVPAPSAPLPINAPVVQAKFPVSILIPSQHLFVNPPITIEPQLFRPPKKCSKMHQAHFRF